jgi:hypothetical protein
MAGEFIEQAQRRLPFVTAMNCNSGSAKLSSHCSENNYAVHFTDGASECALSTKGTGKLHKSSPLSK